MNDSQQYLDRFDYGQLYSSLLGAARTAFTGIQELARGEDFYVFALFTAGAYTYVYVTANTEQGLTRTAEAYLRKDENRKQRFYEGVTLDEMRRLLRHSPADSPYHCLSEYDVLFDPINVLLGKHADAKLDLWSELSREHGHHKAFDLTQRHWDDLINVFLKVLKQLDGENVFGSGVAREKVVLNILMGDQDSSYIEYAKLLNPSSVFARFTEEISHS